MYVDYTLHIIPDPKYFQKLEEALKIKSKGSKPTPCTHEAQLPDDGKELDATQSALYRKFVGILLYMAQDRPDIQFSIRGLSSKMSTPTHKVYKHLVHTVMCLRKAKDYHMVYRKTPRGMSHLREAVRSGSHDYSSVVDSQEHCVECNSDSDWAGCKGTRKSTSSGNMFLDGQLLYSFSRTQKTVALSSGEAEYYASASSASDAVLVKEVVEFLSQKKAQLHLFLDSSAARGVIARRGVGRIKHIQIRTLFLQDLHKQGKLTVRPVGTKENTADLGTKPLSGNRIRLLMGWLGFYSEGKPVEKEKREHMESKQLKAMVHRVRRVGTLHLQHYF